MSLRLLSRSVLMILLLLTVSSSTHAAFNFSDVKEVQDNTAKRGGGLTSLGEGEGEGFYMTIYEDIVRNPNRRVEEKIEQRFGVDFEVNLSPPKQTGKFLFTDFFDDPFGSSLKGTSTPTLKSSLQSDCVRIRAAQAEDVTRRWRLLRKRLGERNNAFEEGRIQAPEQSNDDQQTTIVDRELVQRLIGLVETDSQAALDAAIANIPEYQNLTNQDTLLRCYQDFSREVDFELRLQSLLHPTKQQMEVLSTFMNGRLDDFTDQNAIYGSAFPRYDLIFDIDVIDYIVFGSPIAPVQAISGGTGQLPFGGTSFSSYRDIQDASQPPGAGGTVDTGGGDGDDGGSGDGDGGGSGGGTGPHGGGFGTSTGSFAGPFCVADLDGVGLDLTTAEERQQAQQEAITIPERPRGVSDVVSDPLVEADDAVEGDGEGEDSGLAAENESGEGKFQKGPNLSVACEGTAGVDFGNDFMKLLFCINIGFEKTGKSWNTVRDDNCIACHMYRMNEVFEEYVLKSSVRPHKNTGTIMESAICEDGYGDDVGFHFFLEWAPVKLFPSICYPEGGNGNDDAARQEYAEMVGYPEILNRFHSPSVTVQCGDYKTEEDKKRCQDAVGGSQLPYAPVQAGFLNGIQEGITDIDDVSKASNIWAKLAGNHGIAERELYFLLYRTGQAPPRFEIDATIPQDFKLRADALQQRLEDIKKDSSLVVNAQKDEKLEQYLCLRGFALAALKGRNPNLNCDASKDSFSKLEADIVTERNRVMRLVQRWNQQSRDFNGENQCQTFQGSGVIDAFKNTFKDKIEPSYFLETDFRRTQNTAQQLTGQIATNSDIGDFETLFSTINEEVQAVADGQRRQQQQETFETDQQRSLTLLIALQAELQRFNSNMQAYTDWWSEMVDEKQFVSKGGERINVLQSYFEKLQ